MTGLVPSNEFLTDDDILDLTIPVRADRFAFDLLDLDHNQIGVLDVDSGNAPTVTVNGQQAATRSCSGLSVSGADLSYIDTIRNRVAVSMILQNGSQYPLGVYMFGQDNEGFRAWGSTKTPELADETFVVDRALESTATLPVGGSVIELIVQLLTSVYLPAGAVIEANDQLAGSPLTYRVGSGRYAALAALAGLVGCYPPFFDNQGVFRFKPVPAPTDTGVDHIFEEHERVIADSLVIARTTYRAPNRYMVIGDDATTPIVGIYDLPAAAPHSFTQTGQIVTTQRSMQGLSDPAVANVAAYVDALTDHTTYQTCQFSSTDDPRHGTFDTFSLNGLRWLEVGWSLQCKSGGTMTHQGNVIWA